MTHVCTSLRSPVSPAVTAQAEYAPDIEAIGPPAPPHRCPLRSPDPSPPFEFPSLAELRFVRIVSSGVGEAVRPSFQQESAGRLRMEYLFRRANYLCRRYLSQTTIAEVVCAPMPTSHG